MSVNRVILIGNVGKEPEVRYVDKGLCVASFSLATTEKGYATTNGLPTPDHTEWHYIVAWRTWGEWVEQHIHKGMQLYIEGKIRTRIQNDTQGGRKYITEIYAEDIQLLGNRQEKPTIHQQLTEAALPPPPVITGKPLGGTSEVLPF